MMRREQFSPDKTVSIVSQKQHGAQTKGKNYSWNKIVCSNKCHSVHKRQSFLMLFTTVNSRFKKDLKLQIHLQRPFFSDDRFLDSLHKSFLNQTTLDLIKEKWTFINREFTVSLFTDYGHTG